MAESASSHGQPSDEQESDQDITELMAQWYAGDEQAFHRLFPLIFQDLRQIARNALMRERQNHTWVPTELVNEAFLRLVHRNKAPFSCRSQFFGVAARVMRYLLIDHAKARKAEKRGGGVEWVTLQDADSEGGQLSIDMEFLNESLDTLARMDPRAAKVVEMKFFAGLTNREIGELLQVSEMTVIRDWKVARRWLQQRLQTG